MGQTLTHGIYLPDEGERNCYNGLAANWQLLDGAIGTIAANTAALAGKAPLVHTHTKSDITDFPALANVATSGSYNDLSNIPASFTPASHTHGNITNDGKVGTAANKPLITGTDGVIQAGSFGNAANTFCEGNDSRLSDARTPVAHTHGKADITDLFNSANTWTGSNAYEKTVTLYNSDDTQSVPALYLRNSKAELSSSGNTSSYQDISFRDKNDTNYACIRSGVQSNGSIINLKTFAKNSNNNSVENTIQIISFTNGTKALFPVDSGTDLGNSNYKWKTLNGTNPGALSLPKVASSTLDTTNWNLRGGLICSFTPRYDGFISVQIKKGTDFSVWTISDGRQNFRSSLMPDGYYVVMVWFPCRAGFTFQIYSVPLIDSPAEQREADLVIQVARIWPCEGNV